MDENAASEALIPQFKLDRLLNQGMNTGHNVIC